MLDFVERVVVVGAGGIGSWLLDPLCCFLSAEKFKGQVAIWDGDRYEPKNLIRQRFHGDALNLNKADAQAMYLKDMYPDLQIFGYSEYIVPDNIERAVKEGDLVFVCVDNHPARALIAGRAEELKNVCILSAGNELYDGNCHVTLRRGGKHLTQTLIDRHPEVLKIKEGDRAEIGCEELIQQGEKQLLFVNLNAAVMAINCFYILWIHGAKHGRKKVVMVPNEAYFDITQVKSDVVQAPELVNT